MRESVEAAQPAERRVGRRPGGEGGSGPGSGTGGIGRVTGSGAGDPQRLAVVPQLDLGIRGGVGQLVAGLGRGSA